MLPCPAGCPLALLSCEKWFRADKSGLNQRPGTLQGHERQHYTESLIHSAFSCRFSSLNFPTMHLPSRRWRRYLHAKAHHALCECWLWLVMFRTHKKTSLGRSTRQKEKGGGWLFCILGGLPPLVGKLNIYILQLELLFFSHFIFQNIDYTLPCCVECCSGTVMACTCLLVTQWKRRRRPLDRLLLPAPVC